ncbi:hypothetical protein LguiA_021240 [Lonicera macranthoides]
MIRGSTSSIPNEPPGVYMYGLTQDNVVSSSIQGSSGSSADAISTSLLCDFSILTDKFNQVQSQVRVFLSLDQNQSSESTAMALATVGSLIQDIIITASSMMLTCQQMSLGATMGNDGVEELEKQMVDQPPNPGNDRVFLAEEGRGHGFCSSEVIDWYGDSYNTYNASNNEGDREKMHQTVETNEGFDKVGNSLKNNCDIIELDAEHLLAKYTHYCQICGKGFKRDANLRMHMRAHGEEYKSTAALINPMKKKAENSDTFDKVTRKYSCPQEGCRWNKKHAKFQPLKSMICVKNHYKRSHCPKMYVCKRCNVKQFSVLSDLRTHEKHCGDNRWMCSCGTTFSRKDKLLGHVALFVGHAPAVNSSKN